MELKVTTYAVNPHKRRKNKDSVIGKVTIECDGTWVRDQLKIAVEKAMRKQYLYVFSTPQRKYNYSDKEKFRIKRMNYHE